MKQLFLILSIVLLIACNEEAKEESEETEPTPIAQVKTQKLQKSTINETLTVYGTVLPWADKVQTISLPYSSQVEKILVNDGQLVQQGETLLILKPSKDALLQLNQARQELTAAQQEQKLLKQKMQLKLATEQELVTAQLRVNQANAVIENLMARGVTQTQQVISAERTSMVSLVSVQQGQIVPAGNPLLQLVDKNQWVVRLGVEPEDFDHLQVGQQVLINPVNKPIAEPVKGRIEIITQQIDPATRLLNVFVRPESNQALLINDFVQADIAVSAKQTLVVPRAAVLPDGDRYSLFTIHDGHAVKHSVQVGLENATQFEIISNDIQEGDEIVVLGNYELQDDMAVEVQP